MNKKVGHRGSQLLTLLGFGKDSYLIKARAVEYHNTYSYSRCHGTDTTVDEVTS